MTTGILRSAGDGDIFHQSGEAALFRTPGHDMRPPLHAHLLVSALLAALAGLGACASAGPRGGAQGDPVRVSFRDYRTGTELALVNESHTDRLDLYSKQRSDASTKVAADEIVDALIEYFEDQGFYRSAREGRAPVRTDEWTQAIEVETPDGAKTLLAGRASNASDAETFRESRDAFIAIYNNVYQAQAVEATPGDELFRAPTPPTGAPEKDRRR